MNVTFNLANTLTALAIIGGLLVVAHRVGKWTQSVDGMLRELKEFAERNAEEILSLRKSRHEHGEEILILKQGVEGLQEDVGELQQRQKDER